MTSISYSNTSSLVVYVICTKIPITLHIVVKPFNKDFNKDSNVDFGIVVVISQGLFHSTTGVSHLSVRPFPPVMQG